MSFIFRIIAYLSEISPGLMFVSHVFIYISPELTSLIIVHLWVSRLCVHPFVTQIEQFVARICNIFARIDWNTVIAMSCWFFSAAQNWSWWRRPLLFILDASRSELNYPFNRLSIQEWSPVNLHQQGSMWVCPKEAVARHSPSNSCWRTMPACSRGYQHPAYQSHAGLSW